MKIKTEMLKGGKAAKKAAETLSKGGIIIYPTETSYGIGVDATNDKAVKKIIELKKRNKSKGILIAFSDLRMARKYLVITKDAEKLAKAFMPGPLSLIVRSKSDMKKNVGFRIPNNETVLKIIRKFGKPITTTSANLSGKGNIYKIKDAAALFGGKADLIIDGGNLKKTKPSTVYDVAERKILRKGPVSEKKISKALKQ